MNGLCMTHVLVVTTHAARPQQEIDNGTKLYIGGTVAKRLVQNREWGHITHIVECQDKLAGEVPQAMRLFLATYLGDC